MRAMAAISAGVVGRIDRVIPLLTALTDSAGSWETIAAIKEYRWIKRRPVASNRHSRETTHAHLLLRHGHLRAGLAHRAQGRRRRLSPPPHRFCHDAAAFGRLSGPQSQGPRAGSGDARGHPHRAAG